MNQHIGNQAGAAVAWLMVLASAADAAWQDQGVPICTASGTRHSLQMVHDGAGGAVLVWDDRRAAFPDVYAQRIDANGDIRWTPDGVMVSGAADIQWTPVVCPDGSGGVYIAWGDRRSGADLDVYAQRLDADGTPLWTLDGIPIAVEVFDQSNPQVVPDESGGCIIAWTDQRNAGAGEIYAQRVNPGGTVQWGLNGVRLRTAIAASRPWCVSNGAGGVLAAWSDGRSVGLDVYAQKLNDQGASVWDSSGVALSQAAFTQSVAGVASDGAGGGIVGWVDNRTPPDNDFYCQRVDADGTPRWTTDGVGVSTGDGDELLTTLVADGSGGAITAWGDTRGDPAGDLYAQKLNANGTFAWASGGIPVCTLSGAQLGGPAVPDGAGGAVIVWSDGRSGTGEDIYAQRMTGTGSAAWTPQGNAVCTAAGNQNGPQIVATGSGETIVAWLDARAGTHIYAQKLNDQGFWYRMEPAITSVADVPSDEGGFVTVAWDASRADVPPYQRVTHYSIWRSLSGGEPRAGRSGREPRHVTLADVGAGFEGPAVRLDRSTSPRYAWEWLANQPAVHLASYGYTAPTLFDSLATDPGWHHFLVVAHSSDSLTFWESAPDSGYSVDNLAPSVPTGLQLAGSSLSWDPAPEPDFNFHTVWGSATSDFADALLIGHTVAPTMEVGFSPYAWYFVTTSDFTGNRSGAASIENTALGTVATGPSPSGYALHAPVPSPFSGTTVLSFDLPERAWLELDVFDVRGGLVRSVFRGPLDAGRHGIPWDGRDLRGAGIAPGVYFVRLEAGTFSGSRKLVRLR